jgi:hypothetical protein
MPNAFSLCAWRHAAMGEKKTSQKGFFELAL